MRAKRNSSTNRFHIAILLALSTLFVPIGFERPAHAGLFSVSPDKERRIGAEASREIEAQVPLVTGPVEDWVSSVGKRLTAASKPEFEYSFRVIDSPEINAFALPGGYIYVYSGLRKIARSDDELAAILAHEITHAEEHHFARQYSKASKRSALLGIGGALLGIPGIAATALDLVNFAITQKYSRSHEYEADEYGMRRLARAGYDPAAMVMILDRLAKESDRHGTLDKWFGSHPEGAKRIAAAQRELINIKTMQAKGDPLVKPITITDKTAAPNTSTPNASTSNTGTPSPVK